MHNLDSPPKSVRQEVLDAAAAAVLKDRNASYGPPESNFQDIAEVWNWYHGKNGTQQFLFTAVDVAIMMILMKMARLKYNPNHRDSKIDVAGYAACAAECESQSITHLTKPEGEKSPLEILIEMQNQFQSLP